MHIGGCKWIWDYVILGQPASKANSRQMVRFGSLSRSIKSKKARDYCQHFAAQCADKIQILEGDVALLVDVFYSSRRPDLACLDLIQDCLQGIAYHNDRQVKAHAANWHLDKHEPRARIRVAMLDEAAWGDTSTGVTVWS